MLRKETGVAEFLFLLFIFLPIVAYAQPDVDVEEAHIDEIFSEWDRSGSPGCAVGVYSDSKVIFSKGYGEAVLKDNIPITPQTVFYAGSVSKQFTAAAIALLHLRGKLDLDRPVRNYIPEMPDYPGYEDPTVRQLVHHTSGLPDLYSLLSLYDVRLKNVLPFEEMVSIITGQSHLNFKPGSEYLYSNSGYTLLAELVERVSDKTLREYTTEHLFEPLGMHNTHFHDDRNHEVNNKALSYRPDGDGKFKLSYLSNFEGVGPGGLYTTIEDLVKWDQQLYKNRLSDAEGFNELMHQRGVLNSGDTLSYTFALRMDEHKGQKTIGHSGSFMGFKADYLRMPNQEYGSALLCNQGDIDPAELNKKLADLFWEGTFEEWLNQFEGTYYSEALDLEFSFSVKNGELYLERETHPTGKLTYVNDHTFSDGGWEFEFRMTSQGKAEGFILSSGRAKAIVFKKKS